MENTINENVVEVEEAVVNSDQMLEGIDIPSVDSGKTLDLRSFGIGAGLATVGIGAGAAVGKLVWDHVVPDEKKRAWHLKRLEKKQAKLEKKLNMLEQKKVEINELYPETETETESNETTAKFNGFCE